MSISEARFIATKVYRVFNSIKLTVEHINTLSTRRVNANLSELRKLSHAHRIFGAQQQTSGSGGRNGLAEIRKQYLIWCKTVHSDKLGDHADVPTRYMAYLCYNAITRAKETVDSHEDVQENCSGFLFLRDFCYKSHGDFIAAIDKWAGLTCSEPDADGNQSTKDQIAGWSKLNCEQKSRIIDDIIQPSSNCDDLRALLLESVIQVRRLRNNVTPLANAASVTPEERLNMQQEQIRRGEQAAAQAAETAQRAQYLKQCKTKANPVMPASRPKSSSNDLSSIDHIEVDFCYLSQSCGHILEVPYDLQLSWASAYSTILHNIIISKEDNDDIALERSLKWLLAIHHVLLRYPKRGKPKTRQYNSELFRRFRLWEEGNYSVLISEWVNDCEKLSKRKKVKNKSSDEQLNDDIKRSVKLALDGFISRAVRIIESSCSNADMQSPDVLRQASCKHPQRKNSDYWDPTDIGEDCPPLKFDCKEILIHLDPKSGKGPSGFANAYLKVLVSSNWPANTPASLVLERFNQFASLYMNDHLQPWFMYVLLSGRQIGLSKGKTWVDGCPDYRFIGVGEILRRVMWKAAFKEEGKCFQVFSEPLQLALGTKSGGQILALGTAALMELYPDHVFIKDDLVNMFGAALRKEGVKNITECSKLKKWWRIINAESYPEQMIYISDQNGRLNAAPYKCSEGGQQGSTSALLVSCAAIQPYLKKLDDRLKPFKGSARKGIDDGVTHGPPEVIYEAVNQFYEDIKINCGLSVNRTSTMIYSPNGNYNGKPDEFKIGTIDVVLDDGEITQSTGLTIWGVSISKDTKYIEQKLSVKAEEVCSIIKKVTTALTSVSSDVAMVAHRLSLIPRMQYHLQTHCPSLTQVAAEKVQSELDNSICDIFGFDPAMASSFAFQAQDVADSSLVYESLQLPVKYKGLGLRKISTFLPHCAYVSNWSTISSRMIDKIDKDGNIISGLYPLIEPLLGAHSQDSGNENNRFSQFIDGSSKLGNEFKRSVEYLKAMCPDADDGVLSKNIESINFEGAKMQKEITAEIEEVQKQNIQSRFSLLPFDDRRRIAFQNRRSTTLACFTTTPSESTQVPQNLFTAAISLAIGAIDPTVAALKGKKIGNSNLKVDIYGDALASARLPGDRWRISHDALKNQIYVDLKYLGITVTKEMYGLFSRFMSENGRNQFSGLDTREKKLQTIIPDLVTNTRLDASPLMPPGGGLQMWELKRIQAVYAIDQTTGDLKGCNKYYLVSDNGNLEKAADKRAKEVPYDYERKARVSDEKFGIPGQNGVLNALRRMAPVRGLAFGAFGEFSSSVNLLIKGASIEGAMLNAEKFGQTDSNKAQGIIAWWLKKRWSRLSLISAVQSRYDALRYVGGSAQQQAAEHHNRAQRVDDIRYEQVRRLFEEQEFMQHAFNV